MSVRYRLRNDSQHPFSEAIGVVQSVATDAGVDVVAILTKRGDLAPVRLEDVLAAKVFPLSR